MSSVEVDLTPIAPAQGITVMWQGKPIFIRHRTPQEIRRRAGRQSRRAARSADRPARVKAGHDQWIVLIGICTHLGCIPLGNKPTDLRGDWGGWFCPCHGSQYDTSGRMRKGPAPLNLALPPYAFESDTRSRSAEPHRAVPRQTSGKPSWPACIKAIPESGVNWIDSRLPIFTMMQKEYGVFPTPRNFNYFWNFGALAMVTPGDHDRHRHLPGDELHSRTPRSPSTSVQHIMRDVNYGWLIRYVHQNGASMFFIVTYIHIFRGLYYGSYKAPRELLWMLGVVILLLMMATAFMGYVLPWGQMSYWGATVITNLFSAFPVRRPARSSPGCGAASRSTTRR